MAATARPPEPAVAEAIDERALPVVGELARVARGVAAPAAKLESALDILFGAYAGGDREFSGLMLRGWLRARDDKQCRLRLAWQREQLRLALQDILAEGAARGAFRPDLDTGAIASVMLGAAEGCLLQAATEGGPVSGADLARTLVALTLNGA